ncbi:MAG: NUDIX domain-containing protein [Cryobacterium sp.]|nr:NUDIX domain-containing protein [Cryobacterium sp.]
MAAEGDGSPVEYGVGGDRPLDGIAATVVLLRDGVEGLEILLLERPHDRGSFAGAWVFPGGVVEAADHEGATGDSVVDDAAALRRAGARETFEETALVVEPDDLVHLSTWHPPQHPGRRYLTTFFIAAAPAGAIVPSPDEVADYQWARPADAIDRHTEKRLLLFPPTWVTLRSFAGDATVAEALARVAASEPAHFATRFASDRSAIFFEGDVAYDDESLLDATGPRHRVSLASRPWVYSRSA